MLKISKFILLLLIYFSLSKPALAQENINISFDKSSAFVGDIVSLKVKAQLPQGAYINASQKFSFSSFDVLGFEIKHIDPAANIYEIDIKIAAYKTGVLQIEPQTVFYINPDGSNNLFFTPAADFEIKSILGTAPAENIKDIKPLKKLPVKTIYIVLIIFSAVLLIVCIFAARSELLKSKNKKEDIILDPKTAALKDLETLYQSPLKKTEPRLFYYKMSEIFRLYISKQYNFNALEMTSAEIFEVVKKILPQSINVNEFKSYLKVFVLAQYAAFKPEEKEIKESFKFTKELLEKL